MSTSRLGIPASAHFVKATRPLANHLGLYTFPYHAHEVALGYVFFQSFSSIVSPALSRWLIPKRYKNFDRRTRINWDVHVTSTVNAVFISSLALYILFTDPARKESNWQQRLWGYNRAIGTTQAISAGYFLWDVLLSIKHIDIFGADGLGHAVAALLITLVGFVSSTANRTSLTSRR